MKKAKTEIRTANVPLEMAVHIALLVLQIAVIVGVGFGASNHDWTFWVILATLSVAYTYFALMLLYKLYRARLTFITVNKDKVKYFTAFRRAEIKADKMKVAYSDYGKPTSKTRYAVVYDEDAPENGFLFAFSAEKGLEKFKDCAPIPLLKYIIGCTSPDALAAVRENASDELKSLIDGDVEERVKTRESEQNVTRKKKKKKRK